MIKARIVLTSEQYDSDDVYFENEQGEEIYGFGYKPKEGEHKDTICLMKCPSCKKENYAMVVSSGQCSWCGYKHELPK